MTRPRIILTARWPASIEAELKERYDVTFNLDDHPFSADELRQALRDYDAVCPTVVDPLNAKVMETHPIRCRIIANFGVGINHIDLEMARKSNITVTNTPGVLTNCTADLTMTLILMAARRAGEGERLVRAGQWHGWRPTQLLGTRVTGKTLGIIGMGRIGQAVARRAAKGFGMHILYHHPRPLDTSIVNHLNAQSCATVDELLPRCDFVSLHCPGGAKNRHLIGARELQLMPSHAYLINTARGEVVDTQALIEILRQGRIRGAALDVYENEPRIDPQLTRLDNVVLLPHLGSATSETRTAMGLRVLQNLDAFFAGRTPPDRVV